MVVFRLTVVGGGWHGKLIPGFACHLGVSVGWWLFLIVKHAIWQRKGTATWTNPTVSRAVRVVLPVATVADGADGADNTVRIDLQ